MLQALSDVCKSRSVASGHAGSLATARANATCALSQVASRSENNPSRYARTASGLQMDEVWRSVSRVFAGAGGALVFRASSIVGCGARVRHANPNPSDPATIQAMDRRRKTVLNAPAGGLDGCAECARGAPDEGAKGWIRSRAFIASRAEAIRRS